MSEIEDKLPWESKTEMNDPELIALAAIVQFQSQLYSCINQDRLRMGFSLAYEDTSSEFDALISELHRRGVLHS